MWRILIILLLIPTISFSQNSIEYISEKCDSMALISKSDIDIINNVFYQRNQLLRLNSINNNIIHITESKISILDSIIHKQKQTIQNDLIIRSHLIKSNEDLRKEYEKLLRKERRKTHSFQIMSAVGIIAIIFLLL